MDKFSKRLMIVFIVCVAYILGSVSATIDTSELEKDCDFWKESAQIQRKRVVELEYRLKLWETL